jgi:hypothetical protein
MNEHSQYDDVFFAEISRMNDAGELGGSKIIQVAPDKAILIHWRRSMWAYDVYPFQPLKDHLVKIFSGIVEDSTLEYSGLVKGYPRTIYWKKAPGFATIEPYDGGDAEEINP